MDLDHEDGAASGVHEGAKLGQQHIPPTVDLLDERWVLGAQLHVQPTRDLHKQGLSYNVIQCTVDLDDLDLYGKEAIVERGSELW